MCPLEWETIGQNELTQPNLAVDLDVPVQDMRPLVASEKEMEVERTDRYLCCLRRKDGARQWGVTAAKENDAEAIQIVADHQNDEVSDSAHEIGLVEIF